MLRHAVCREGGEQHGPIRRLQPNETPEHEPSDQRRANPQWTQGVCDDEPAEHEEHFDAKLPAFAHPIQDRAKQRCFAVVRQHSVEMKAHDAQDRDAAQGVEQRETRRSRFGGGRCVFVGRGHGADVPRKAAQVG